MSASVTEVFFFHIQNICCIDNIKFIDLRLQSSICMLNILYFPKYNHNVWIPGKVISLALLMFDKISIPVFWGCWSQFQYKHKHKSNTNNNNTIASAAMSSDIWCMLFKTYYFMYSRYSGTILFWSNPILVQSSGLYQNKPIIFWYNPHWKLHRICLFWYNPLDCTRITTVVLSFAMTIIIISNWPSCRASAYYFLSLPNFSFISSSRL